MSNTLRLTLLPLTLALALMLALVTILGSDAESKPGGKPVPQDRIADVQLLGVSDARADPHDLDVRFTREHGPDARPHDGVVVRQQHRDHVAIVHPSEVGR